MRNDLLLLAGAIGLLAYAAVGCGRRQPDRSSVLASATLTPGVLNASVTQSTIRSTICRRGWTTTIRPPTEYTSALKLRQMGAYGETGPPTAYQEDHLISLELGGHPTDPRNLWPEPYPRASEVDRVENDLNAKVCSGALTLAAAQRQETVLKHDYG
jgi:hypothetical protein